MPDIPNFKSWPSQDVFYAPDEIVRLYESGFSGIDLDPHRQLAAYHSWHQTTLNQGGEPDGGKACSQIAGSGEGKLSLAFIPTLSIWPGCLPGGSQAVGDCVSWGQRNALLISLAAEIAAGEPDPVTGIVEGAPEVTSAGIRYGVLSTEAIYVWRESNSHGWHCDASAEVVTTVSGCWLRKPYPELDVDLTEYSGKNTTLYGRQKPPEQWKQEGSKHLARTSTRLNSYEQLRDMLSNYYGVNSCGSEGFDNQRDEWGAARRKGSWAHSMAYIAVDDRQETVSKYGSGLVLVQNSWGTNWISGPRDIHESAKHVPATRKQEWINKGIVNASTGNILIPEGSFWARWDDLSRRGMFAFSSINGWPPRVLPDYGIQGWG